MTDLVRDTDRVDAVSRPITVLVVDDDPSFADLASRMLEREHDVFDVRTATSADDALSAIEDRSIDCVVSDYGMPGMTGLELLEAVRSRDPDLPFVLFTGKGSEEIASEAIASGVTQYLQKKPGSDQYALLASQITNAVSQYRTRTELRESERRHERTLTVLHEATRDLMRAGTKTDIYRSTVETADDVLEVPMVAAYAFEPTDGVLEQTASTDSTRETLGAKRTFERGEGLVWEAFSDGETAYYEDVRAADTACELGTLRRSQVVAPLGTHGVLVVCSGETDGFAETTIELLQILAANTEAALDRAEREQLLREHDRTLTEQNEELTRLNRTNEIVREVTRGVAKASTREEIERTICDRLADADRYVFAWVTPDREPSTWAGVGATYVDRIREAGPDAPEASIVRRALTESTVQLVENVLDDRAWESRRAEALTHGFQTVLAVPLIDGERQHGALVVHARHADAISDDELDVLAELGETIGHAMRSVERTHAMVTDERIELEVRCGDERLLFNRLSSAADCPISLEGAIRRDDVTVFFVSVAGPPVEGFEALDERWAVVEHVSVVSEGDDDALFEVTATTTPLVDVLREYDARLCDAHASGGDTTLVLHVPQRIDTRSLVESIREGYPETELAARRETARPRPASGLDGRLEERLTDRQFEALQAAHYSGFFDWPRESTGEDLAEVMDVSPPTFHYHLRAAQRKLAEIAFD